MNKWFSVFIAIAISSCATVPEEKLIFIRTDGQQIRGNAALEQQGQIDKTICLGQTQQSALGMPVVYTGGGLAGALDAAAIQGQRQASLTDVAKGCMAQKGYVQVRESDAPERLAEYQKTAAQRKKLTQ